MPIPAASTVLESFASLRAATDEEIVAFASEHGTLWTPQQALQAPRVVAVSVAKSDWSWRESLHEWRLLSGHFRSLVDLAAACRSGSDVSPDVLAAVAEWPLWRLEQRPALPRPARSVLIGMVASDLSPQHRLAEAIDDWSFLVPTRFGFDWPLVGSPSVTLRPLSMLGAAVIQLMFVAARSDGLATCSACGRPYTPTRKTPAGRRNYCQTCRDGGASVRDAKRDYDARRREKEND